MDWKVEYKTSANLNLQLLETGDLGASTSFSRTPQQIDSEAIPILLEFAKGTTAELAHKALSQEYEFELELYEGIVEDLVQQGILVSVEADDVSQVSTAATQGFASLDFHFAMVGDQYRVLTYKSAIQKYAKDKEVLEIGCGTGILSIFALQAGAKHVTVIEETSIADVAAEMFRANGFADRVTILRGNSLDVEVERKAELLIHELLGTDPIDENMLLTLADARARFLQPNARLLPGGLQLACVGLHVPRPVPDTAREVYADRVREFEYLYGVDFSPFGQRLDEQLAMRAPRTPADFTDADTVRKRILTDSQRFLDVDLHQDSAIDAATFELTANADGELGALLVYFRAPFDEVSEINNSPFAQPTHWRWHVRMLPKTKKVSAGDKVSVKAEIKRTLQKQRLDLQLV